MLIEEAEDHYLDSLFFVLRLNVPVNDFPVLLGRSQRLCLTTTTRSYCVLLKDPPPVGIEPSDALPLRHRAPYFYYLFVKIDVVLPSQQQWPCRDVASILLDFCQTLGCHDT